VATQNIPRGKTKTLRLCTTASVGKTQPRFTRPWHTVSSISTKVLFKRSHAAFTSPCATWIQRHSEVHLAQPTRNTTDEHHRLGESDLRGQVESSTRRSKPILDSKFQSADDRFNKALEPVNHNSAPKPDSWLSRPLLKLRYVCPAECKMKR